MNGKRPEEYDLIDFLTDDSFVNYYLDRNDEDVRRWKEMLSQDSTLMKKANKACELLQLLSLRLPEPEFQEEYRKLSESIAGLSGDAMSERLMVFPAKAKRVERKSLSRFLTTASMVLIAGALWLVYHSGKTASLLTVRNNFSGVMQFTLTDGTVVSLGAGSELDYYTDFNKTERNVYLRGDAGFHVKRDPQRPFKVFEDKLTATVLGTIFNVVNHFADSSYSIELVQGSLKVDLSDPKTSKSRTLYLKPHERAFYKKETGYFFKEAWNSDTLILNKANHLIFKSADFETVAKRIKEVYGMTMVNRSRKKNWHFTAEFTNAEFKEVLQNLCIIEGVKSQVQGDSVLLQ
jgi:ferric-dicitrate binding protein FerR (iron transport regulator)